VHYKFHAELAESQNNVAVFINTIALNTPKRQQAVASPNSKKSDAGYQHPKHSAILRILREIFQGRDSSIRNLMKFVY
jgi:hypothetical protein